MLNKIHINRFLSSPEDIPLYCCVDGHKKKYFVLFCYMLHIT